VPMRSPSCRRCDNGQLARRGKTSIRRMREKWKNAPLIHLPIHASCWNQIELYFSIVQREALTPDDFASPGGTRGPAVVLRRALPSDQIARPFE
jgi:hypothetical protein